MKRNHIFFFLAGAALFLLGACQEKIDPVEGQPAIAFAVDGLETKGLLNADDLQTAGTALTVYDYLTGFEGTVEGGASHVPADIFPYFGPQTLTRGASDWSIGTDYRWTKAGTHAFFGWLSHDATGTGMNASDLFGSGQPVLQCSADNATRTLSIPTVAMTTATPQFDFAYSAIEARTAGDADYSGKVTFQLKHLFSAMSLTLENASKDVIYLQSAEILGLYNKKSATVDYSPAVDTPEPTVVYTPVSYSNQAGGSPIVAWTGVKTLEKEGALPKIDLWTGAAPVLDAEYKEVTNFLLMWPQTSTELHPDTNTGKPGAAIKLTYKVKDLVDINGDDIVQTATIPLYTVEMLKNGMKAGYRYKLSLQFEGETFKLKLQVLPWEYIEENIGYAESSISAYDSGSNQEGKLWFYLNGTQKGTNYSMDLGSQDYAAGEFSLNSPQQGEWNVEIYPATAAQYFVLELPADRSLTESMFGSGNSNYGKVTFKVRANPDKTPTATQTIHFNVLIRINSEWHDANSEFNRKDWKISRQPNT